MQNQVPGICPHEHLKWISEYVCSLFLIELHDNSKLVLHAEEDRTISQFIDEVNDELIGCTFITYPIKPKFSDNGLFLCWISDLNDGFLPVFVYFVNEDQVIVNVYPNKADPTYMYTKEFEDRLTPCIIKITKNV